MTSPAPSKTIRLLLWMTPVAAVAVGYFAAIGWLKTLDDAVVALVTAAAGVFVLGYALFIAGRVERSQDEVERAGGRFAFQAGAIGGTVFTVLALMLPPFQNLLVDAANVMGTGSAQASDRESVAVALFFGFGVLAFAQTLGVLIVNVVWTWWIGRS